MPNPQETSKIEAQIKANVASLNGDLKSKYLSGLRDGCDLAALIADDNGWNLSEVQSYQTFLDYLDSDHP